MEAIACHGTTAYKLCSGKTLPEYLKENTARSLRKNNDFRRRLELLQNFCFPVSSNRVRIANDGRHLGAIGAYPPELRVYDTENLTSKFIRGFDAEATDFIFLSDDYKKLALLFNDRSLEFHAQGGRHCKIRLPHVGRCLSYIPATAEVIVAGSSNEIYRIDLETGVFGAPISGESSSVNTIAAASGSSVPLLLAGGSDGLVEGYDTRTWHPVASLVNAGKNETYTAAVTAIDFTPGGYTFCTGDSDGVCRIFDIRSSRPLATRDHRNGVAIRDLHIIPRAKLLEGSLQSAEITVASADSRSIKIWALGHTLNHGHNNGETQMLATLEPDVPSSSPVKLDMAKNAGAINSLCVYPESGLIFVAQDNPRIGVYFLPALGVAPKWCSFLESLTEELEESKDDTVYENLKFVTKQQLDEINAANLIGTPVLKAYMHGYFMDWKLYNKLRAAAMPFAYEEYRKQKLEEKLAKSRTMRIQTKTKLPKVNKALAQKLQEAAKSKKKSTAARAETLLGDERFSSLFNDPGFAIEAVPLNAPPTVVAPSKLSKRRH